MASSSSTPVPFDAQTPPVAYSWSDEDRKLIGLHKLYYIEMVAVLNGLEQFGPQYVNLPQKPRPDIKKLFPAVSTSKPLLAGHELHMYLCQYLTEDISDDAFLVPQMNEIPESEKTITKVVEYLIQGAIIVNQQHKKTMKVYIQYGRWLNYAFLLFEKEKFGKRITCTWDEWLRSVGITISTSYARKPKNC